MNVSSNAYAQDQPAMATLVKHTLVGRKQRQVELTRDIIFYITATEARQLATSLTEIAAQIDASVIAHQVLEQVAS